MSPSWTRRLRIFGVALALVVVGWVGVAVAAQPPTSPMGPKPKVLTVGTWNGKAGQFTTIQAAVDAAAPGDWAVIAWVTTKSALTTQRTLPTGHRAPACGSTSRSTCLVWIATV